MLKGEEYDEKVDMWSLGIIIYVCVTGTHPFIEYGKNTAENIKNKHLKFNEKEWKNYSLTMKKFL